MEIFDNMETGKVQNIKQDEINGEQHSFHSYPKELQAWHNTQYMLEKKAPIDESTIPESLLNGYMWQVIGDASKFGLTSFIAVVIAVIKLKLSPDFFGLFISFLFFLPWMIYAMYHFVFYAKIRAQVVGPVTVNGFKYTSKIFYETYFSIILSMSVAFLFVFQILDDIIVVLRDLILTLQPGTMSDGYMKEPLIWLYNICIRLMSSPDDTLGKILSNVYFSTGLFTGLLVLSAYLFEKHIYNSRREVVEQELRNEKNLSGYPIDNALRKLKEWRKENGI